MILSAILPVLCFMLAFMTAYGLTKVRRRMKVPELTTEEHIAQLERELGIAAWERDPEVRREETKEDFVPLRAQQEIAQRNWEAAQAKYLPPVKASDYPDRTVLTFDGHGGNNLPKDKPKSRNNLGRVAVWANYMGKMTNDK